VESVAFRVELRGDKIQGAESEGEEEEKRKRRKERKKEENALVR